MDNWIIGTKLFIMLYCVIKYVSGEMRQGAVTLLIILLYACLSMLFYISKNEGLKKFLLGMSLLLLLFSGYRVDAHFLLLVPMNGAELAGRFTDDLRISLIPAAITAVFIDSGLLAVYLLASFFSLCMFILIKKVDIRINVLAQEIDILREKNDTLYRRLDMSVDYENQLKYLSQMEERNSLAQKIHDKVGHAIAGSLIQLEAASVIIESDRSKADEIIRNVINVLKDGMESIRSTLRNIKPAAEQLGINRLKVLLDEFSLNSTIKASLSYSGTMSVISHLQWRIITDNLKEALTNTLKYSTATAVNVRIEVLNKLIRVEMKDTGAGTLSIKKGLGLRGIEERTENAGGKVIIDGSKGFSIILLLPHTANNITDNTTQ